MWPTKVHSIDKFTIVSKNTGKKGDGASYSKTQSNRHRDLFYFFAVTRALGWRKKVHVEIASTVK